jgi:hypothetical protein
VSDSAKAPRRNGCLAFGVVIAVVVAIGGLVLLGLVIAVVSGLGNFGSNK